MAELELLGSTSKVGADDLDALYNRYFVPQSNAVKGGSNLQSFVIFSAYEDTVSVTSAGSAKPPEIRHRA